MKKANPAQIQNTATPRSSQYPIDEVFLTRWSTRAFDAQPMPTVDLKTLLEAARWAPSAYNVQPWRFIVTQRESIHWQAALDLLDPFNADWAQNARALIFLISDTQIPSSEPPELFPSHSFDTGSAWAHIALQAAKMGYQAHAMAGIFHEKIRQQLRVPKSFNIEIAIAVGTPGDPQMLSPALREREAPSQRLPLSELVFSPVFGHTEGLVHRQDEEDHP